MNNLASTLQEVKEEITIKINKIIKEKNIPACIMEGILMGVVSDIREQKNTEMFEEIKMMQAELQKARATAKRTLRTEPEEQPEEEHLEE